MPYFESDDYKVRREAAVTCCHMLALCMIKVSLLKDNTTSGNHSNGIIGGIGMGSCSGSHHNSRHHSYSNVPQTMTRMSTINSSSPSAPLPKRGQVSNITNSSSFITGRTSFNTSNNDNIIKLLSI